MHMEAIQTRGEGKKIRATGVETEDIEQNFKETESAVSLPRIIVAYLGYSLERQEEEEQKTAFKVLRNIKLLSAGHTHKPNYHQIAVIIYQGILTANREDIVQQGCLPNKFVCLTPKGNVNCITQETRVQ